MFFRKLRKTLLLLIGACSFLFSNGQDLGKFDVVKGLEKYPLGSAFDASDSAIKFVPGGELEYKGRNEYSYLYEGSDQPYILADVGFKNVLLTYESKRLIRINLDQFYTSKLFPDFEKKAKQDYQKLYKYLKAQWKASGKKKTFSKSPDKSYVVEGYQWNKNGRVMKLSFYKDKGANPFYSIDISLESSGLE